MSLYSESELRALLAREEGQFLEFKSLWDRGTTPPSPCNRRAVRDKIAEYVAAFANADGGVLLLGVEDDGRLSGHGYAEEDIGQFLAVPSRRLRPQVQVAVQRARLDGQELLVLQVPMVPEAVMVEGNGFPYRVGDQVVREEQETINERKQAYRRVGYEQRTRPEATIGDLDSELARSFLASTPYGQRPIEEVLAAYGLVYGTGQTLAVTNAAVLLFGKRPFARWHPRAGIRFLRVNGTQRTDGRERNVTKVGQHEPPIAAMIQEAYSTAAGQIRKSERLHNLFFREMPEYPTFAWQEAIVNAIAHRDYMEQGREIEVTFYDDRMEVSSPGELILPVTLDALRSRTRVHSSRNPLLVRVLVDAGIMREEGEGVPRMHEEMRVSCLRPPEFGLHAVALTVTLRNEPVFEGATYEWSTVVHHLALSTNQKRALLAYPDGFSNEDYRMLNGVDRDAAYREIAEMVDKGILTSSGLSGRGASYRVSPGLTKWRTWLEQRIPKVAEILHTQATLRNADYRAMFHTTRVTALRDLSRLVDEGFLCRTGTRKAAVYTAGPRLPQLRGA